ncbi:uncharacterized protein BKA55DRAFT_695609 [Fusarium redolens]|uniref:DUF676 domain-containing protein n=1 Tax=Fusarium redolens TaxID=48865 RepID=A0A9P9G539_FUSRE|nr:uncharacterized protein BKA55DRAFT_695609 [Fusarium redolens]KAH7232187.1 hypothetical protein BKA55DRAFT_695609 [Fusarium redolens]
MSWRKPEEELSWSHLVIVIAIAIGAWLLYRQYDAAAKRMQRRQVIPFGELRIVKEGEDPKFQIIAVQALGSHSVSTWKSKEAANKEETDLLLNLLPAHLKDARSLQWVYNSDWEYDGSVASLPEFGRDLLRQLNAHFERYEGQDDLLPVVFLGYSFGGLVIKEAFFATESNDDYLWKITRGIIFLGKPHLGSSMPQLATLRAFCNRSLCSNVELIKALNSRRRHLKELLNNFNDRLRKGGLRVMPIVSISDTKPMYQFVLPIGLVIDSFSSEIHAVERLQSACSHTELNIFTGVDDQRPQQLVHYIKSVTPPYIPETTDKIIWDSCYADGELKVDRLSG